MDVITWIVLGLGAGVLANMTIPGRSRQRSRDSDPACARHGADRGQVDISAAVIRIFERLGWATKVRWPTPARLDSRRRYPGGGEPEPGLQPGGRRTGRAAASRLSPLPAGGGRIR